MALLSYSQLAIYGLAGIVLAIVINLVKQIFFQNKNEPPVVFHWIPFVGSTITYGMEPYKFMAACRQKYGDIFTFVLLGRKTTVYLGTAGNEFILNAKEKDVNAEEIYGPLCNPVFGKDVVYDCPNAKLMEQKKFIKYGLSQDALVSMVGLIEQETHEYLNKNSAKFKGQSGVVNMTEAMAQVTIFTAGGALQGPEVRAKLTEDFADLFHDLEKGFTPINFMMPWFPLPQNRVRDRAHEKMKAIYMDIIRKRRASKDTKQDMIWNLMRSVYKNGTPVPDAEVACIMLTLLMAGQHNSANISAWTMLHLANQPEITEKLYQEQLENLGRNSDGSLKGLTYEDLDRLPLHNNVIKETLRLHNGIHSILRQVKNDMPIPGTDYVVPKGHVVLAAPGVSAREEKHFPDAMTWNPWRWESIGEEKEEESDMVDYGYGRVSKGTKSPYLPFGAGRHRCIGEKFAYINLVVIIATMVRNFKVYNMPGVKGVPKTDYSSLFSCPLQPTLVKWERRNPA